MTDRYEKTPSPEVQAEANYTHTVPDVCETVYWRGQILSMNELAALAQQPAAAGGEADCRCIDCGGNQPGHDQTCSYMHELHGEQPAAVGVDANELAGVRARLKSGDYDGADVMKAWLAIDKLLAQQPAPVDGAAVDRVAAALLEEATGEPWTVAGVEHGGPDRDYYRKLARKVLALAAQPGGSDNDR